MITELRFYKHITSMVNRAHTRVALIKYCFRFRDRNLLFKAFLALCGLCQSTAHLCGILTIIVISRKLNPFSADLHGAARSRPTAYDVTRSVIDSKKRKQEYCSMSSRFSVTRQGATHSFRALLLQCVPQNPRYTATRLVVLIHMQILIFHCFLKSFIHVCCVFLQ